MISLRCLLRSSLSATGGTGEERGHYGLIDAKFGLPPALACRAQLSASRQQSGPRRFQALAAAPFALTVTPFPTSLALLSSLLFSSPQALFKRSDALVLYAA